jgi:hypothetical protein
MLRSPLDYPLKPATELPLDPAPEGADFGRWDDRTPQLVVPAGRKQPRRVRAQTPKSHP